jgi:hypothetical protein
MKQVSIVEVNKWIESLKAQRADLLEDKAHMLSHYDFDCAGDEFEYDIVCSEIEEIEKIIYTVYETMNHPQTIIADGIMYYTDDEY